MSRADAERFMNALRQLEQERNVEALASLFGEDAELQSPSTKQPLRGVSGAHAFWEEYLRFFGSIRSHFTDVIVDDRRAALEWESDGQLHGTQRSVHYSGVTIVEFAPDGRVTRFRTYFDQTPLQEALEPRPPSGSRP